MERPIRVALILTIVSTSFGMMRAQSAAAIADEQSMRKPAGEILPYVAQFRVTTLHVAQDGSSSLSESTETIMVNSQGHRLIEKPVSFPNSSRPSTDEVTVVDPDARTTTLWSVPGKRAIVTVRPDDSNCDRSSSVVHLVDPSKAGAHIAQNANPVQDLGTETIFGVEAHGERRASRPPSADGASQVAHTHDRWRAVDPGLNGLIVREVSDGRTTRELLAFEQREPDPQAFEPPQGYEIITHDASSPCGARAQ